MSRRRFSGVWATTLAVSALQGCALEPGARGLPIPAWLMIAAGLALVAYGVTLTPWFRRWKNGGGPTGPRD